MEIIYLWETLEQHPEVNSREAAYLLAHVILRRDSLNDTDEKKAIGALSSIGMYIATRDNPENDYDSVETDFWAFMGMYLGTKFDLHVHDKTRWSYENRKIARKYKINLPENHFQESSKNYVWKYGIATKSVSDLSDRILSADLTIFSIAEAVGLSYRSYDNRDIRSRIQRTFRGSSANS